jgi:hypothetical protein
LENARRKPILAQVGTADLGGLGRARFFVFYESNTYRRAGQGVSAPGCICTLYLKYILNIFTNVKKI